jgi:hypothetical protein
MNCRQLAFCEVRSLPFSNFGPVVQTTSLCTNSKPRSGRIDLFSGPSRPRWPTKKPAAVDRRQLLCLIDDLGRGPVLVLRELHAHPRREEHNFVRRLPDRGVRPPDGPGRIVHERRQERHQREGRYGPYRLESAVERDVARQLRVRGDQRQRSPLREVGLGAHAASVLSISSTRVCA